MNDQASAPPPAGAGSAPADAANGLQKLSAPFRVRFDEARPDGTIRSSVWLRYAAELAWVHSERLGFGRGWYRERGLAWLVRGIDLEVLHPIADGATVIGTTTPIAARQVVARRRTEFHAEDGRLVATVDVDWAMVSGDGPTRIPAVFLAAFPMVEWSLELIRARDAPDSGATESKLELVVRPQELDPMGHVNNAVYLDWLEEAITTATGQAGGLHGGPTGELDGSAWTPRRYRLEFRAPAAAGQRVRVAVWPRGAGEWSGRIVDAGTGQALVGARLTL